MSEEIDPDISQAIKQALEMVKKKGMLKDEFKSEVLHLLTGAPPNTIILPIAVREAGGKVVGMETATAFEILITLPKVQY